MNGEEDIVPFLEEALAKEKEQPMMYQHLFQYLAESALTFDASVCKHQEDFRFIFVIEGQE